MVAAGELAAEHAQPAQDVADGGAGRAVTRRRSRVPRRWWPRRPVVLDVDRSALPLRVLRSVQAATFAYTYRGVPCFKNPFDLALYSMLIHRERPATLLEIGSAAGGSALWFADQCRVNGLSTAVISVDVKPPSGVEDPTVEFIDGDVHALANSRLPSLLSRCARPLMVVEDGPHTYEGCLSAMRFVHDFLEPGEYLIIEDGILNDLGYRSLRNGPNRAIKTFRAEHPDGYEIDRQLCDFFGRNVTWNPNGYLRRR